MSDINKIYEDSNFLNHNLERILYCIRENKFICNKEFEDKFKFKFTTTPKSIDSYNKFMVNFNGKHFGFDKGNRIINFIINGKSQKRFIYSYDYLKSVLNELKIDYVSFYVYVVSYCKH